MRAPLLVILVVAAAGCFSDEAPPSTRSATASGGKVSEGWDYAGAATTPGGATLTATFNDPEDTGNATVAFDFHGASWTVTFDQVAGPQPFMDGGVEFDLTEHGDSGTADASIPRIMARVAAWGTALVTKNGAPVTGAAGGRWSAHLMLSDDSVRGADNKISNAAGGAYDPAKAGDARVVMGDPQALLKIVHPDGESATRAPLAASATLAFAGPETTQTVDVPSEAGAALLVVNVTVSGPQGAPVGAGQAVVTLRDAGGNATDSVTLLVAPNQPSTAGFEVGSDEITGPMTVEVVGTGAFTAVVDHVVTFDDHPFLTITWDEYASG